MTKKGKEQASQKIYKDRIKKLEEDKRELINNRNKISRATDIILAILGVIALLFFWPLGLIFIILASIGGSQKSKRKTEYDDKIKDIEIKIDDVKFEMKKEQNK